MSVAPEYLTYNDRDYEGWPRGLSTDDKLWVVRTIDEYMRAAGRSVTIQEVEANLFDKFAHLDMPESLRPAVLFVWRFAVVERGLRAANAYQVWTRA